MASTTTHEFDTFTLRLNGRLEYNLDIDPSRRVSNRETGPMHSGAFSSHFGREFGKTYVGGFSAVGIFDGLDANGDPTLVPRSGTVIGVDVMRNLTDNVYVTGQLGYGNIVADPVDSLFRGYVASVAINANVNDKFRTTLSFDNGRSPKSFSDYDFSFDQPGAYWGAGLSAEYKAFNRLTVVGAVNSLRARDFDDDQTGTDLSLYLGGRITFGQKEANAQRLTTPIQVFRAAGWMEALDN